MLRNIKLLLPLAISLVMAGCAQLGQLQPTFTPVPTSTPSPTETPTFTPSPPTATPTRVLPTATTSPQVSFSRDVLPIFQSRCIQCHSGDNPPRGLRLTDYENVLKGGIRPVIIPGDPDGSLLVEHVRTGFMPLGGPPLTQAQINTTITWVAAGAANN